MPEKFNISVGVNVDILDAEVDKWKCTHNYNPIIITSASTFREIATSTTKSWYDDGFNWEACCGRIIWYKGLRVFFDPEKSYGDIELR